MVQLSMKHYHGINTFSFAVGEAGGDWDAGLTEGEREECKENLRRDLWDECCQDMEEEVIASSSLEAIQEWTKTGCRERRKKEQGQLLVDFTRSAVTESCMCVGGKWRSTEQHDLYRVSPFTGAIERWEIEVEYTPETPGNKKASGQGTRRKKRRRIPLVLEVSHICVFGKSQPPKRAELTQLLPLRRWVSTARGTDLKGVYNFVFPAEIGVGGS